MGDTSFPYSPYSIKDNLIKYFDKKNKQNIVKILNIANPDIDFTTYDNWNGGITYYSMTLYVPLEYYADIEDQIEAFEAEIYTCYSKLFRELDRDIIDSFRICPILKNHQSQQRLVTKEDIDRIWTPGYFRLFISHVSSNKIYANNLKNIFDIYGISAFVAHEDIDPSREWQIEIENALHSCHSLIAILTNDFHNSLWTDQEVGIALGRKIFVLPIKLEIDPYGFLGNIQALKGTDNPTKTVTDIINVLLNNLKTEFLVKETIIKGLENAYMYEHAKRITKILIGINNFSKEQIEKIQNILEHNDQVYNAFGVPQQLSYLINKNLPSAPQGETDLPF